MPTPLHDRIFVKVDEKLTETAGGLQLAVTANEEKEKTGVVLATGPGRYSAVGKLESMPVQVGDAVVWKDEFGAEKFVVNGEEIIALRVPSIIAKCST